MLPALLMLASCEVKTQPLSYGKDACSYCKMGIVDSKYGAEVLTKKGKVYKFDSAECMIRFMKAGTIKAEDVQSYWVVNCAQPATLIDATKAYYLHSTQLPSPMGGFLTAFSTMEELTAAKAKYDGDVWNWQQAYDQMK